MRVVTALFFLIASLSLHAQRGRDLGWVKGTVKDAVTKEGLPYARVIVANTTSADTTIADFDGSFVIRCAKELSSLRILVEGYLTFEQKIDPRGRMVFVDVELQPWKVFAPPRPDGH